MLTFEEVLRNYRCLFCITADASWVFSLNTCVVIDNSDSNYSVCIATVTGTCMCTQKYFSQQLWVWFTHSQKNLTTKVLQKLSLCNDCSCHLQMIVVLFTCTCTCVFVNTFQEQSLPNASRVILGHIGGDAA